MCTMRGYRSSKGHSYIPRRTIKQTLLTESLANTNGHNRPKTQLIRHKKISFAKTIAAQGNGRADIQRRSAYGNLLGAGTKVHTTKIGG